MSEGKNLVGISKTTFIVGLIIAIVASSIISTFVAMQWAVIQGPKGDTGLAGEDGREVVFAQWNVSWRTLTGDLVWGGEVGTSEFSSTFDYNWGPYALFMQYDDYIGFTATMQVKMEREGPISFTIGSDDGSKLDIDGAQRIDNWRTGHYREVTIFAYLSEGFHTLTLWYYDVSGSARVSFDCDSDILMWYD